MHAAAVEIGDLPARSPVVSALMAMSWDKVVHFCERLSWLQKRRQRSFGVVDSTAALKPEPLGSGIPRAVMSRVKQRAF